MNLRFASAFVLAPAIIPAGLYLYAWFTLSATQLTRVGISYSMLFIVAYGVTLLLGMPLHKYMEKRGMRRLRHCLVAGALLGSTPPFGLMLLARPSPVPLRFFGTVLMCAAIGSFSAAVFWLIGFARLDRGLTKRWSRRGDTYAP